MENYCGYQDPMEFTFENNKLVSITGANGVGKTTIFSAIPFSCFGVTQSGQKSGSVVNNKTGKNCKVSCEFTVADGDVVNEYLVERYVKYKKFGSTAFVRENGEIIARGFAEVTNKMEKILVPKELFFNTILFGQNVKDFFTDLPDSKQKEIFRKILQLDMYVTYKEIASNKLKELQESLDDGVHEIERFRAMKVIHETQIADNKLTVDTNLKTVYDLEKAIVVLDSTIDKLNTTISANPNLEKVQNQLIEKQNDIRAKQELLTTKRSTDITFIQTACDKKISSMTNQAVELKQEVFDKHKNECDITNTKILDLNKQINSINNTHGDEIAKLQKMANEQGHVNVTKFYTLKKDTEDSFDLVLVELNENLEKLKEIQTKSYNLYVTQNNKLSQERELIVQTINANLEAIGKYNHLIETKQSICPQCKQKWDDPSALLNEIDILKKENLESAEKCNTVDATIASIEAEYKVEKSKFEIQTTQLNLDISNNKKAKDEALKAVDQNELLHLSQEVKLFATFKQSLPVSSDDNIFYIYINDETSLYCVFDGEKWQTKYPIGCPDVFHSNYNENISIIENVEISRNKQLDLIQRQISICNEDIIKADAKKEKEIIKIDERLGSAIVATNNKLKGYIDDIEKQYNESWVVVKTENEKLKYDLDELQKLIEVNNDLIRQIESNRSLIRTHETVIKDHKKIINETTEKSLQIKNIVDKILADIKEIQNKDAEGKKMSEALKFWVTGFSASGIQSMLIDEAIPFMNRRISEYLEKMSNGRYKVSFDTMKANKSGEFRDKINVNVYDTVTHSNSREGFSGGQTRLIDIATILTLSDLQENIQGFKTNILLFDEIFDALDEQNIVNVSNLLRRILNEDKSINIVTHRHIDQIEADEVYNFEY